MIGAFVLGATALIVVALVIFGSGEFLKKKYKYVLFFEDSVKGLQVGAPVVFRGVKIGQVTEVAMRLDPSDLSVVIPVYVEIESWTFLKPEQEILQKIGTDQYAYMKALIDKGLRAQLQLQSFVTGLLVINLDFATGKPVSLFGIEKDYPEIPTVPSDIEQVKKKIEELPIAEISESLKNTLAGMEKILNAPELLESVVNLNRLLKDLDRLVRDMNAEIVPLASGIDRLVRDVNAGALPLASNMDKLVRDVNAEIGPLSSSLQKAADAAYAAFAQAEKTLAMKEGVPGQIAVNINETLAASRSAIGETEKTAMRIADFVAQNSGLGLQVHKTLEDLSVLSRSLRSLADYLERHPEALIRGKIPSKGE